MGRDERKKGRGGKEGDPVCILTIFLSITYDISDVVTIAADAVAVA